MATPLQGGDSDSDEYGQPEEVEVSIDNTTTPSYSLVRALRSRCCESQGPVYLPCLRCPNHEPVQLRVCCA